MPRELKRKVFVVAVLVFPEMEPDLAMEPDPAIEERAANDRVEVLFGADDLVKRLVALANNHEIYSPPSTWPVDEIAAVLMPHLASEDQDDDGVWDKGSEPPVEPAGQVDIAGHRPKVHHADVH